MIIKQINITKIKGLSKNTLNVAHQMGLGKKTSEYWIFPCNQVPSINDRGLNILNFLIYTAILNNVHTLQILNK